MNKRIGLLQLILLVRVVALQQLKFVTIITKTYLRSKITEQSITWISFKFFYDYKIFIFLNDVYDRNK